MKSLLCTLLSVSLFGCASYIPKSDEDRCSSRGMKLAGVGLNDSSGHTFATNFQGNNVHAFSNSSSTSVQCIVPTSDAEKQDALNKQAAIAPIDRYNDSVPGRGAWGFVGYIFYVIPGVIVKLVADSDYDKAVAESQSIAIQQMRPTPQPAPASVPPQNGTP